MVDQGGVDAVKELKGDGKEVGPSDASASSQVSYINALIQQRRDAIVIAANDPNAVAPALKDAMAKGIAVVTYDSDAAPDARQIFVNQANSEEIGRSQVKLMSDQIGGSGKIAILSATPNATNQNTWIEFMKDELTKPEFKNIELVKIAYGDDDDQKSFQEAQGLLQSIPDLKGIISPTTVGISAAARYISSSPYKGKVKLTGLGTPNQMRQFVKDGTVTEFALWNPVELGYLAGYAAAALASGQISGKEGETLKAGKLGERTIGKNGEIILGPPTNFNADNIDDFDF
jgi:rhamnose transport system substrate-binding protein